MKSGAYAAVKLCSMIREVCATVEDVGHMSALGEVIIQNLHLGGTGSLASN
jgi:hypothetical protein